MSAKATAIKSSAVTASSPAKTGNAKSIQRKTTVSQTLPSIQRQESAGSWLHTQPQKAVNSKPLIQPKVKIHSANDHFEKEADHVADKVINNEKIGSSFHVSKVATAAQRKCASCGKEKKEVQAKHIQRKCSSCEEEQIQKKSYTDDHKSESFHNSDSGPPVSGKKLDYHTLDNVLSNQNTRGSPLPNNIRADMESSMGADFNNVRIHTGSASHDASTSVGALAFTHGNNIHFANGEFNPQSKNGRHLLAHELAHTMQQGAAPVKENYTPQSSIKGLRKVVPKAKHEKKIARVSTPYNNIQDSQKDSHTQFKNNFRNKKAPKLSGSALKKDKSKKLDKDPATLPKKAEKKKDKPAKPTAKSNHLQNVKQQRGEIAQLASQGINFKPSEDKKTDDNPAQKAQSLQSKNISEKILVKASRSADIILSSIAQVRPGLMQASANSIAHIKANAFAQKEIITNDVKVQKASVKKAMQNAAGSINGKHKQVTSDLKTASSAAKDDIQKAKTKNTDDINTSTDAQAPIIDKAYADAQNDYTKTGQDVGNECSSRQQQRSWSEFISKMKHEDDSLLDGPYTDDMKQARGDAAVKVGDGYKDSITKAGADQAAEIIKGKPNDLKKIADGRDEMLKQVQSTYDTAFKGIEAAENSGVEQADNTKKSMLNSVYTQHKAAQSKLDVTERMQTQLVEILSVKQTQQIELQAEQSIESMEEGGAQSLFHLNNGFKEYKQVCESMNSPPPAMLQLKLQPIEEKLVQTAPAMAASLERGRLQSETGFQKTAADTITATNSTVTQGLTDAKADNDKAIDGLKKIQGSAVSALQTILAKNKKTITDTGSQCVTDLQGIKTGFDSTLAKIAGDLSSGMQAGARELKEGLQNTVNNGNGDTKSMLATSMEEEQKAADEVQPRWKSALKILLVIAVTLLIALVVGPAVIGFIGAAAGGGAFGAAVGAVVGGAILGAASSAVITIGNNLIDGKTWYSGVGHAMLEGAVTGAIGGAFGAAGGGLAGKIIGTAAKGLGPALSRFAIQQSLDFAGNIATEYAGSKLNGQPFNWSNVAQGQAIGAGMHIGMSGLSALKDVKGFKTINNVMEGSAKFGENLGGAARTKFGGIPKVEVSAGAPKPSVEEPLNKGPSVKEEIPAAKPTEEKLPSAKPSEEVTSVSKEEAIAAKPKEETSPVNKTTEETKAPVKEESTATPHSEEVKTTNTEEPVTPGGKKKSELPANLSQEDVEMGIVGKAGTEDGHNIKVTENGEIIKCSTCERLSDKYEAELKDPRIKQEFDQIKAMPEGEAKAKAAKNFDKKMEDLLINEYKNENPHTKFSDSEIRQKIRGGSRMNPDTGLFNKPKYENEVSDALLNTDKNSTEPVNVEARARGYAIEDMHLENLRSKGYEGLPDYFPSIDGFNGGKVKTGTKNGIKYIEGADVVSVKSTKITDVEGLERKITEDLSRLNEANYNNLKSSNPDKVVLKNVQGKSLHLVFEQGYLNKVDNVEVLDLLKTMKASASKNGVKFEWFVIPGNGQIINGETFFKTQKALLKDL